MKKTFLSLLSLVLLLSFALPASAKKVHTIGDSTMDNYGEVSDKRGWGYSLQQFMNGQVEGQGITVNNRGKSGLSSRTVMTDTRYWNTLKTGGSDEMQAGDILIIQFAHNDENNKGVDALELKAYNEAHSLAAVTDLRGTTPTTTYKANLRTLINEAKAMGVKPILVGAVCRNYFNGATIKASGRHDLRDGYSILTESGVTENNKITDPNDHSMDYTYQMGLVAAEYTDVPFIDFTDATATLFETLGAAYCSANIFNVGDGTHFGPMGATIIARHFAKTLVQAAAAETDASRKAVLDELAAYVSISSDVTLSTTAADFGSIYVGMPVVKEINVSGFDLTPAAGNCGVKTTGNFLVSTDKENYSDTLTLAYAGGTLLQTLYVKGTPSAEGACNGTLTVNAAGITRSAALSIEGVLNTSGTESSVTFALNSAVGETVVGDIFAGQEVLSNMELGSGPTATIGEVAFRRYKVLGGAWNDENIIDWIENRYVELSAVVPEGKNFRFDRLALEVAASGTTAMRCKVFYSTKPGFADAVMVREFTSMTNVTPIHVETMPMESLTAGDTIRVRVYPWLQNTNATGKYICLSNLIIHGYAEDIPTVEEKTTVWNFSEYGTQVLLSSDLAYAGTGFPSYTHEYIKDDITLYCVGTATGKNSSDVDAEYLNTTYGFHCNGASTASTRYLQLNAPYDGKVTVTYRSNNGSATDRIVAIGTQVKTFSGSVSPLPENVLAAGFTNGSELKTIEADVVAGTTYYFYFAYSGSSITKVQYDYLKPIVSGDPEPGPGPEPEPGPTVLKEVKLYYTDFQNWDDVTSSTAVSTKTVSTKAGDITFSLAEVAVDNDGTNTKFTNTEVITAGYAMAAKTATPYIETSVIPSVTTVSYVHAATGGSRGWGLKVKGDGDADWVEVQTAYCDQAGSKVTVEVNRTNVQLRWYNLNASQNAYMTELTINGNVAEAARTFVDFEINLMQEAYTVPAGVTEAGYSNHGKTFNGVQHGWMWMAFGFKVDGPVKISLGGCQYINAGNEGYVVSAISGATLGQINNKTATCYHQDGSVGTWTYNVEAEDSLVVYCGQYCPYIKVEACEYVENVTVKYFDQNDVLLGQTSVSPAEPLAFAYTEADLTIPESSLFRGWAKADGTKFAAGKAPGADLNLYALVTPVEHATTGSHYVYNLKSPAFYPEDHELIMTDGKFHDGSHGFDFANGQKLQIVVSPKAYVNLGLCTYSNTSDQLITNAAGETVSTVSVIKNGEEGATSDGAIHSFYYANANNEQDTLTLTFTTTSYIHSVEVYNVAAPVEKVGHRYNISAGDAATLMMVLPLLQSGDTVYLPNGTYNFGETVLTTISASNVVILGESMNGVIIYNAPDASTESINNTATIVNTGTGNKFENLTIQNGLDYYKANNGRAVTLWDKGNKTTCYRVRLLSYQDTYYSNHIGSQHYFEECEIHGTVDFICGDGSVYFYNCLLYAEKRNAAGGGSDALTASNADASDKGYVFDRCTVQSECPTVSLGRSWNNAPKCAFLLTTFDYSAGNFSVTGSGIERWTVAGMNIAPTDFAEYRTMDVDGNVISPASNNVTFTHSSGNRTLETIINYAAAEAKSYSHFFTDWDPAINYVAFPPENTTSLENVEAESVRKYMMNGTLIIEKDGVRYNALGVKL